jgi:GAF domain-containing protein
VTETDAEQFARLARAMYEQPDVDSTLEQILSFAVSAIGCDHAGVMLVHSGGQIETAAATTAGVEKADQLQLEYDEGPCVSAIEDYHGYLIVDTETDPRWPRWGPRVAEIGMRSVLSAKLDTGSTTVGALNLYATRPAFFDTEDQAVARILARHAAIALDSTRRRQLLHEDVDTQTKIGQAIGILMARHGLDHDQAFAVLRKHSQDNNLKLRVVVQRLIATAGTRAD